MAGQPSGAAASDRLGSTRPVAGSIAPLTWSTRVTWRMFWRSQMATRARFGSPRGGGAGYRWHRNSCVMVQSMVAP